MEPPISELLQNCKCAVHRKLHDYETNLFSGEEELWRMFTDLKVTTELLTKNILLEVVMGTEVTLTATWKLHPQPGELES